MLIAFLFWYRGLAQGRHSGGRAVTAPPAFFGLLISALVLHESIGWPIFIVNIGVILCVAIARRFASK
ncbi:hypothetical protein PGLA_14880 [Paenibacillus glacialis]|uniref:EamA domain-containing protein n=1 Tax=Paenibacillus glacialis TaxID=494026 RepID=A0A168KDP9_9BACL|nr:hypothetical protein PGLA_14880 [Paenibacillus glacialis]